MSSPIPEILVVDDSPENLAWVVDALEAEGFRVRPADSGALALASARLRPPDLVLLDVRMEGLDGYEVCRQLKREPGTREVPVLFMSGLSDVQDRVRGFQVGASDFLLKPLRKEDLVARVKTFLLLAKTRRELGAARRRSPPSAAACRRNWSSAWARKRSWTRPRHWSSPPIWKAGSCWPTRPWPTDSGSRPSR